MNWENVKTKILAFLRGEVFKSLLVSFLKAQVMGGLRAWLLKIMLTEFYDEVAEPYIEISLERGRFEITTQKGKIIVKKLESADENDNQSDYDSASDNAAN